MTVSRCQTGCKAYKPWIRVTNADGSLQKACRVCPYLGDCEWTGEDEVAMAKDARPAMRLDHSDLKMVRRVINGYREDDLVAQHQGERITASKVFDLSIGSELALGAIFRIVTICGNCKIQRGAEKCKKCPLDEVATYLGQ